MKKIYTGKTKDLYLLENENLLLKFKDDVTGEDGIFNPGGNKVALQIKGMGHANVLVSNFFMELLERQGIKTHLISYNSLRNEMEVKNCQVFGKGLEVIFRNYAYGSFLNRYSLYAEEMMALDNYVEFTLKDDENNDPLITKDGLISFSILKEEEYNKLKELTIEISNLIDKLLEEKDLKLIDIKLEYGIDNQGNIVVIDEISAGNMRVFDARGKQIPPFELSKKILS